MIDYGTFVFRQTIGNVHVVLRHKWALSSIGINLETFYLDLDLGMGEFRRGATTSTIFA